MGVIECSYQHGMSPEASSDVALLLLLLPVVAVMAGLGRALWLRGRARVIEEARQRPLEATSEVRWVGGAVEGPEVPVHVEIVERFARKAFREEGRTEKASPFELVTARGERIKVEPGPSWRMYGPSPQRTTLDGLSARGQKLRRGAEAHAQGVIERREGGLYLVAPELGSVRFSVEPPERHVRALAREQLSWVLLVAALVGCVQVLMLSGYVARVLFADKAVGEVQAKRVLKGKGKTYELTLRVEGVSGVIAEWADERCFERAGPGEQVPVLLVRGLPLLSQVGERPTLNYAVALLDGFFSLVVLGAYASSFARRRAWHAPTIGQLSAETLLDGVDDRRDAGGVEGEGLAHRLEGALLAVGIVVITQRDEGREREHLAPGGLVGDGPGQLGEALVEAVLGEGLGEGVEGAHQLGRIEVVAGDEGDGLAEGALFVVRELSVGGGDQEGPLDQGAEELVGRRLALSLGGGLDAPGVGQVLRGLLVEQIAGSLGDFGGCLGHGGRRC